MALIRVREADDDVIDHDFGHRNVRPWVHSSLLSMYSLRDDRRFRHRVAEVKYSYASALLWSRDDSCWLSGER